MKKNVIILIAFLLAFIGCDDDKNTLTLTQGIIGTVKYGEGDCMPPVFESERIYKNYNGVLYFIAKSDYDNLSNGSWKKLLDKSINTTVIDGEFKANLPVGTFIVSPADKADNVIVIKRGNVIRKDLKFWICTSY